MKSNLVVTGAGMITSVGHDFPTACASIRCGLVRPAALSNYAIDEDLEEIHVIGYPVDGYTEGFEGAAKYAVIIQEVLRDLCEHGAIVLEDEVFWRDTNVYVGMSALREADDYTPDVDLELIKSRLINFLPYLDKNNIKFVIKGNASAHFAISQISKDIEGDICKRALVICVDSLVGKNELNYYMNKNRIKMDDNVNGLIPGEAGAAVVIENQTSAVDRKTQVLSRIRSVSSHNAKHSNNDVQRLDGSDLMKTILSTGEDSLPKSIYIDLNGEDWRAKEWANTVVKLQNEYDDIKFRLSVPAESLGDTGAASGLISLCAAIHAYKRGYEASDSTLILSSSDDGAQGATIIQRV